MRPRFVSTVLQRLLDETDLSVTDRVLGVASGAGDLEVLRGAGFTDLTLTNVVVDPLHVRGATTVDALTTDARTTWEQQDAQALTYAENSFDIAFVSEALHHCRSPHRALTEMVRVARKAVIVIESRDSLAMKVARRLRLSSEYEFNNLLLTTRTHGGADFGPVPNYVYRWTEREFIKTIASFDPAHQHDFWFFHGLKVPGQRQPWVSLGNALLTVAPKEANLFGMVALIGGLQPYLDADGPETRLRPEVSRRPEARPASRVHAVRV